MGKQSELKRTERQRRQPFIPKAKAEGKSSLDRAGRVSVQAYVPREIMEDFDKWWKHRGIESRTQALIWLMDDAAQTDRNPPLRQESGEA